MESLELSPILSISFQEQNFFLFKLKRKRVQFKHNKSFTTFVLFNNIQLQSLFIFPSFPKPGKGKKTIFNSYTTFPTDTVAVAEVYCLQVDIAAAL